MRINTKIILPQLILFVISLAFFFNIFNSIKDQDNEILNIINRSQSETLKFNNLNNYEYESRSHLLSYRFDRNESHIEEINKNTLLIESVLNSLKNEISQEGKNLLISYTQFRSSYILIQSELINSIRSGNEEKLKASFNKWTLESQRIDAVRQDLLALNNTATTKAFQSVENLRNKSLISIGIFSLITFILIVIFSIYYRYVIVKPILKLTKFAENVSNNKDYSDRISISSNDEVGYLGETFNKMLTKVNLTNVELQHLVDEKTEELEKVKKSLEERVEKRTQELQDLEQNLEKIVEERTKDLEKKNKELEQLNNLMLGRELKMIELKKEMQVIKKYGAPEKDLTPSQNLGV